jgi:hypothetical protein
VPSRRRRLRPLRALPAETSETPKRSAVPILSLCGNAACKIRPNPGSCSMDQSSWGRLFQHLGSIGRTEPLPKRQSLEGSIVIDRDIAGRIAETSVAGRAAVTIRDPRLDVTPVTKPRCGPRDERSDGNFTTKRRRTHVAQVRYHHHGCHGTCCFQPHSGQSLERIRRRPALDRMALPKWLPPVSQQPPDPLHLVLTPDISWWRCWRWYRRQRRRKRRAST